MVDLLLKKGIYPQQTLKALTQHGVIKAPEHLPIEDVQYQPNSLDLRLGNVAHRVRCSFLPENEKVEDKLKKLTQHSFSIEDGAILEPNCIYIIPLVESLNLALLNELVRSSPDSDHIDITQIQGKANPKSSTGRLDIFTRVITDYTHRFEEIRSGYSGNLYLEVVPKSFPIRVTSGQKLNQLRIRHAETILSDSEILTLHNQSPILQNDNGSPLNLDELTVGSGLFMSVDLSSEKKKLIGYKAKKNRDLIDLSKIGHYSIQNFWDPIYSTDDDFLILEPEAFYIFASKERVRIPGDIAAEMVPYDTGSGELRTHYAGFFDSGFGMTANGIGAKAVLEVRSHDVPFLVEDGQTFFRMVFERNSTMPTGLYGQNLKSNYQGQSLKLGKHFKND